MRLWTQTSAVIELRTSLRELEKPKKQVDNLTVNLTVGNDDKHTLLLMSWVDWEATLASFDYV